MSGSATASITTPVTRSTLTCPDCGQARSHAMPTDACQWMHVCEACGATLKPLPGDCCVFCSYGDVPCPPRQLARTGDDHSGCCG